jgi:hypothetical protein
MPHLGLFLLEELLLAPIFSTKKQPKTREAWENVHVFAEKSSVAPTFRGRTQGMDWDNLILDSTASGYTNRNAEFIGI